MKRFNLKTAVLVLAIATSMLNSYAQTPLGGVKREANSFYYIEISESNVKLGGGLVKVANTVVLNFGREAPTGAAYKITDKEETGIIKFENAISALNYLGAQGWEVISSHLNTQGQSTYVLKLDTSKHPANYITKWIDKTMEELVLSEK